MIKSLTVVLLFFLVSAQAAYAQREPVTTYGFERKFDMSYKLDDCGDRAFGQAYRQVIRDRVEACPFSDEIKQRFTKNSLEIAKRIEDRINTQDNVLTRDGVKGETSTSSFLGIGDHRFCYEFLNRADWQPVRDRFFQYMAGKGPLPQDLPEMFRPDKPDDPYSCEEGAKDKTPPIMD